MPPTGCDKSAQRQSQGNTKSHIKKKGKVKNNVKRKNDYKDSHRNSCNSYRSRS